MATSSYLRLRRFGHLQSTLGLEGFLTNQKREYERVAALSSRSPVTRECPNVDLTEILYKVTNHLDDHAFRLYRLKSPSVFTGKEE